MTRQGQRKQNQLLGRIFEMAKEPSQRHTSPMFYLIGIVVTLFLATILITKKGQD